jgi:hypothetical protein
VTICYYVTSGDYANTLLHAVFSTKEKATQYINDLKSSEPNEYRYLAINECFFDEPFSKISIGVL